MKKHFQKLFILLLIVIMSITAFGCSFVKDGSLTDDEKGGSSDNGSGINTVIEGVDKTHSTFNDVLEGNVKRRNVVFNTYEVKPQADLNKAIENAKYTSVAITMNSGVGSGVIVDASIEGITSSDIFYIITCHHVVSDAGSIKVELPDENCEYGNEDYTFTGFIGGNPQGNINQAVTLIGGDFSSDIAVLQLNVGINAKSGKKLSNTKVHKAKIAKDDQDLKVGEEVFAIGNPTGELPGTFSHGYIAYPERTIAIDQIGNMTLTQIGVSTNPGSSGGGLYNLSGELIGITNAGDTNYEQINFAIPFKLSNDTAQDKKADNYSFIYVAKELMATAWSNNYGAVEGSRRKFGFTVQAIQSSNSVLIAEVTEKGIAYNAGLKVGDTIEKLSVNDGNDISLTGLDSFSKVFKSLSIGDKITLKGYRKSTSKNASQKISIAVSMNTVQFWFCNTGNYNK
ncbi:MAG: S1C family serine protease [Clostridia bacterium]|nr:S1C family serine protease [Clostridia bacterium]